MLLRMGPCGFARYSNNQLLLEMQKICHMFVVIAHCPPMGGSNETRPSTCGAAISWLGATLYHAHPSIAPNVVSKPIYGLPTSQVLLPPIVVYLCNFLLLAQDDVQKCSQRMWQRALLWSCILARINFCPVRIPANNWWPQYNCTVYRYRCRCCRLSVCCVLLLLAIEHFVNRSCRP